MASACQKCVLAMLAGLTASGASAAPEEQQLEEVLVTARRTLENAQDVPVAVSVLPADRLANDDINSLEKLVATLPDLILTRGNSGSGLDISLRGIGSNFSSIGIEQSVAVLVDGVYYGQGRVIDEALVDLDRIEVLKGPQALFFGKNSSAGVISITTANPGAQFEAQTRVGYDFATQNPQGELVLSGPVTETLGLRLTVWGQDMLGGYVRNDAPPGTYTTTDAATLASTVHYVPAPSNRNLPAESTALGRLTATYRPGEVVTITLKASAEHDEQGGTSWNDRLWKCPGGYSTFPGSMGLRCGDGFEIEQNPIPADIAATQPDLGREGGQLYTLYESRALTAEIDAKPGALELTSITNYQHFDYASNSDYDFTPVPAIWAGQNNSYRAVSQELRARTNAGEALHFLGGVYYQDTALNFTQSVLLAGSENSLASPSDRYLSVLKNSATNGQTLSGYGQVLWSFLPEWELTAGARYTRETKNSYLVQPYVNPFLTGLYADNGRLSADQFFRNVSPEVTLNWKPTAATTLYAAYRSGYKSGGFSNSSNDIVGGAGVKDLTFQPETAAGAEVGIKSTLLDRTLRVNADLYHYRFTNLQVEFFDAENFALIDKNAGAAISEGAELQVQYLPLVLHGVTLHGALNYNVARYRSFIGPCYAGETRAQGCNIVGPPPDLAVLQDLSGKPTADSPLWTATVGTELERRLGGGLALGGSIDLRFSSRYAVSPFAQPLDFQPSYASLDATVRVGEANSRWQLALIGRNLTNRFIVTYATDLPSTGTAPGGTTGRFADQYALFAPARTIQLQFTYRP
jgi:iron complex outermembrane receptor protein